MDLSDAVIWGSATKVVTMQGTAGGAVRFAPVAHRARFEQLPRRVRDRKGLRGNGYRLRHPVELLQTERAGPGRRYRWDDRPGPPQLYVGSEPVDRPSLPRTRPGSLTPYPIPTTAVAVGATVTSTTLTLVGTATVNAQVRRNA